MEPPAPQKTTVREFDPHVPVTVSKSPLRLRLQWQSMLNASQFSIARRGDGIGAWMPVADSIPAAATNWTDKNVSGRSPGGKFTHIRSIDEGTFKDGRWIPNRRLNGRREWRGLAIEAARHPANQTLSP